MDHVCVFIDGSNFYHALKEARLPTRIDFGKLSKLLAGPDRKLMQTFYYNTPLVRPARSAPDYATREQQYRDQQRFFDALRYTPNLTLRLGRFQKVRRPGGEAVCPACQHHFTLPDTTTFVEKSVDVMLAADLLIHAMKDHYQVAILVSSDADYKRAVEAAKLEFSKVIELHQVEGSRCYDLIGACSAYVPITEAVVRSSLR